MSSFSSVETSASFLKRLGVPGGADPLDWERFVTRYGPLLLRWAAAPGLGEQDAEDVVQNVLLKVFLKIQEFRYDPNRGQFRGWLRKMTHDEYVDLVRKSSRRGANEGVAALERAEAREELERRLAETYDLELLDKVEKEVASEVNPDNWKAYSLCHKEGLSGEEAARRLGKTKAAVLQGSYRVMQLIRSRLRQWEEGAEETSS